MITDSTGNELKWNTQISYREMRKDLWQDTRLLTEFFCIKTKALGVSKSSYNCFVSKIQVIDGIIK